MSRYASIDCPICKKALDNGDDIVVCPECGAPYHKSCYQQKGRCIFQNLHQKGEAWKAPNKENIYDGNAPLRCPRCGTINPSNGIFCQVCGNKLNDKPIQNPANNYQAQNSFSNNMPFNQSIPKGIPLNPYTTPFGGVAPDEEIDGIKAKDLAIFVGKNAHYFLPVFKELSKTKSKIINWGAFFFHGGYFLYRKMYLPAILILCIYLLLDVPNAIITIKSINSGNLIMNTMNATTSQLITSSLICTFLSIALRFLCGLFANSIYKDHCKKKILQEKQIKRAKEEEYYNSLSKKGSVATKLVTGLIIGYMSLYILSMYVLILFGTI